MLELISAILSCLVPFQKDTGTDSVSRLLQHVVVWHLHSACKMFQAEMFHPLSLVNLVCNSNSTGFRGRSWSLEVLTPPEKV